MAASGDSSVDSALWGGITDDWGDEITGGGGGGGDELAGGGGGGDDFKYVYKAVAAGDTVEQVRRVIEMCARGSAQRRAAAVNCVGSCQAERAHARDETPLAAATRLARGDLVALLVDAGADVPVHAHGALLAACIPYGRVDTVHALLRAGVDANAKLSYRPFKCDGATDTCCAAHLCLWPPQVPPAPHRAGPPQLEILEVLAREGNMDADARDGLGRTPLLWIPRMASGHEAAVDLLVSLGADVNVRASAGSARNETPLLALLQERSKVHHLRQPQSSARHMMPCVRKLVAAGAQTSGVFGQDGRSPLALAAVNGHVEAVRFLLAEAGVLVDERNPVNGETALCSFSRYAWFPLPQMCSLLLDAGADANAADDRGRTPIFGCASSIDRYALDALRVLVAHGASADVVDRASRTPLMVACGMMTATPNDLGVAQEVLRRSSAQTRRAVCNFGMSAVDYILGVVTGAAIPPWHKQLIAELLSSGAPVLPQHALRVLPIAVSHALPLAARNEAELAERRSEARRRRALGDLTGLALGARELREAQEEVAAKRRRVEELERELGGSSSGANESGGDDDEEDADGSGGGEGDDEGESGGGDEGTGEGEEGEEGGGGDSSE